MSAQSESNRCDFYDTLIPWLYSFQSVQFFYLCGQSGDSQVPRMWNQKFRSLALGVCKKFSKITGSWASPQNHYGKLRMEPRNLHILQRWFWCWSELSPTALKCGANFEDFTIKTNSWNIESIMGADKDREEGTVLRKKHFQRMADLSPSWQEADP